MSSARSIDGGIHGVRLVCEAALDFLHTENHESFIVNAIAGRRTHLLHCAGQREVWIEEEKNMRGVHKNERV